MPKLRTVDVVVAVGALVAAAIELARGLWVGGLVWLVMSIAFGTLVWRRAIRREAPSTAGGLVVQGVPTDTGGDAVVRIIRPSRLWRDRLRKYEVVIDGQVVGSIGNGQTAHFAVQPGTHEVRLEIDWTGSRDSQVEVRAGSAVTLECRPNPGWQSLHDGTPWLDLVPVSRAQ